MLFYVILCYSIVYYVPIPVALRSKAWVCSLSLTRIVGSNPKQGHGCLSLVSFACCQVEVSATSWSLVQRSRTECGVYKWVWSWSLEKWGGLGPQGAVEPLEKKYVMLLNYIVSLYHYIISYSQVLTTLKSSVALGQFWIASVGYVHSTAANQAPSNVLSKAAKFNNVNMPGLV
jgi:hypothetical protein